MTVFWRKWCDLGYFTGMLSKLKPRTIAWRQVFRHALPVCTGNTILPIIIKLINCIRLSWIFPIGKYLFYSICSWPVLINSICLFWNPREAQNAYWPTLFLSVGVCNPWLLTRYVWEGFQSRLENNNLCQHNFFSGLDKSLHEQSTQCPAVSSSIGSLLCYRSACVWIIGDHWKKAKITLLFC